MVVAVPQYFEKCLHELLSVILIQWLLVGHFFVDIHEVIFGLRLRHLFIWSLHQAVEEALRYYKGVQVVVLANLSGFNYILGVADFLNVKVTGEQGLQITLAGRLHALLGANPPQWYPWVNNVLNILFF